MTLTAILAVAACLVGANTQCNGPITQTIFKPTAVPATVVDGVIAQSLIDTIQLMVVSNLLEEKVQPIGYGVVETISPCGNNIVANSYISPINTCGQNLQLLAPPLSPCDPVTILPVLPCNPCCNPCNCNQTSCSCNNCNCNSCCYSYAVPSRCNYCAAPCSPCASPCNPCGSPCNQCSMPCNTCSYCCPCNSCSCDGPCNCNQNSCSCNQNCNSCSGNPCPCNQCYNLVLPPIAPQLPCGVGYRPAAAPVVAASYSGCCSSCGNNYQTPCSCVPVASPCCGATIAAPVCPDISCLVRPICA